MTSQAVKPNTKVLFVTNDAWFFVSHRLPLAEALIDAGVEGHVAARADHTVDQITSTGAIFHAWKIAPRGQSAVGEVMTLLHLAWLILIIRPKLAHLITIKAVLYGGLLSRLLRVNSVVLAVSGLGAILQPSSARGDKKLVKLLYRWVVGHKRCHIIFQNTENRDALLSWLDRRVPNKIIRGSGVDLKQFSYSEEPAVASDSERQVVIAARLLRDKGISEFVAAAEQLKHEGIEASFVVAGEALAQGSPGAYSESELNALLENEAVNFIGARSDIDQFYKQAHIVVLPSYHEGLPKTLVEAGACGRPIVTTDIAGCRDAVNPGVSALMVPVGDAVALKEAIATLLSDKAQRIKMGKAGHEYVKELMTIEIVVADHMQLYRAML